MPAGSPPLLIGSEDSSRQPDGILTSAVFKPLHTPQELLTEASGMDAVYTTSPWRCCPVVGAVPICIGAWYVYVHTHARG
ncbi:hypothetical protein LEMLEM_LOCUS8452, partial [Lemmus lemmus]